MDTPTAGRGGASGSAREGDDAEDGSKDRGRSSRHWTAQISSTTAMTSTTTTATAQTRRKQGLLPRSVIPPRLVLLGRRVKQATALAARQWMATTTTRDDRRRPHAQKTGRPKRRSRALGEKERSGAAAGKRSCLSPPRNPGTTLGGQGPAAPPTYLLRGQKKSPRLGGSGRIPSICRQHRQQEEEEPKKPREVSGRELLVRRRVD